MTLKEKIQRKIDMVEYLRETKCSMFKFYLIYSKI